MNLSGLDHVFTRDLVTLVFQAIERVLLYRLRPVQRPVQGGHSGRRWRPADHALIAAIAPIVIAFSVGAFFTNGHLEVTTIDFAVWPINDGSRPIVNDDPAHNRWFWIG